ncbi:MAG: NUDIX domain-containing protein [Pseudomonadota bacterium]
MKKKGTSMIFLNDADQVLLFQRDDKPTIPFPNCWDILGGHMEEGETPAETIIREIEEEIGLKLHNPVLFKVFDMADRIENTFWQRANLNIATQRLNEGQRLKWFTENEIRSMTNDQLAFGFRSVLLEFFRQKRNEEPDNNSLSSQGELDK